MDSFRRKLLWIDGSAGALVGVLVLALSGFISGLHKLPQDFVLFLGWVNLGYGLYSMTLASRPRRPMALILLLIAANAFWAVMCFRWAWLYSGTASIFGLLHLAGEGLWVGGLAVCEWIWRDSLRVRE